jgi:hypothetical protein
MPRTLEDLEGFSVKRISGHLFIDGKSRFTVWHTAPGPTLDAGYVREMATIAPLSTGSEVSGFVWQRQEMWRFVATDFVPREYLHPK